MKVEQKSTLDQENSQDVTQFRMRPMEVSDANTVADWYQQIEDVSIFDRHVPVPINHAEASTMVKTLVEDQEKGKCCWFMAEEMDGTPVGMTALEAINKLHGNAILPVFVAQPWRRSGVGIRMICMMIDLAFKQLRLHRVSTVYRADNVATDTLINRLGFQREGTARQAWFSHGEYFDLINVGVLVDEWEQTRVKLRAELNPLISVELGPRCSEIWSWPGPK